MKKLRLLGIAIITVSMITSCSEEMMNSDLTATKGKKIDASVDEWPAEATCINNYTLIAGQSIVSGSVIVGEYMNDIYIKYSAGAGYLLTEAHVYIGDVATILDKNGGPKIGHFPYHFELFGGTDEIIFKISKDDIAINADGEAYEDGDCFEIAAHAVVVCAEDGMAKFAYDGDGNITGYMCEETGWAKPSGNVCVIKSRMDTPNGEGPTIAATANSTEGIIFDLEDLIGNSLDMLMVDDFVTVAGNVDVELDGDIVRFTITSDYGLVYYSWLYVGSRENLESIGPWSHHSFPYKIASPLDENNNPIGDEQHVFEVPYSAGSDSGFTFGGARWGYYIQYCPC